MYTYYILKTRMTSFLKQFNSYLSHRNKDSFPRILKLKIIKFKPVLLDPRCHRPVILLFSIERLCKIEIYFDFQEGKVYSLFICHILLPRREGKLDYIIPQNKFYFTVFLFIGSTILIGRSIKLSVQTFHRLIVKLVYHHWGSTLINRSLSQPFISLSFTEII